MNVNWLTVESMSTLVFVTSITPGPNNMMVMTSGARFGVLATLPHLLGVASGFALQLLLSSLGLGAVLLSYPRLQTGMALACAAYLVWLAWRIASQRALADPGPGSVRPMHWHAAVAFQFVNPKAWGMSLALSSMIATSHMGALPFLAALVVLCAAINLPCVSVWAAFGSSARRLLQEPRDLMMFNGAMAVLLVTTAVMMLAGTL